MSVSQNVLAGAGARRTSGRARSPGLLGRVGPTAPRKPRTEHAQDSRLFAGRCFNLARNQLLRNTLTGETVGTVAVVLLAVAVVLLAVAVVLLAVVLVWLVLVGLRGGGTHRPP